jgi:hypothetical protein
VHSASTTGGSGSSSFLDFRVSARRPGRHTLVIRHDHAGPEPLALGLSVDRSGFRTVVYPPTPAGQASRTTTVELDLPRRAAVIRLAEGRTGARVDIASISLQAIPRER